MIDHLLGSKLRDQSSRNNLTLLLALITLVWPTPSLASLSWMETWDTWKNVGSIMAVFISLVALVATQRTTHAKTLREKREELKEMIEKLLDFRSEWSTKGKTFVTQQELEFFSVVLNTRKSIYLESAEYLARQLPHVTPAEWIVLGEEYLFDSNFVRAEALFKRALHAARKSSLVMRTSAVRSLAAAQMMQGAAGRERGRQTYRQACEMISGREDAYSIQTVANTYRKWSGVEYQLGNIMDARGRVKDALRIASRLPDWYMGKQVELQQCASTLLTLSYDLKQVGDHAACLDVLADAAAAIESLNDDFSKELRGRIHVARAAIEQMQGRTLTSLACAAAARTAVETLPPSNPGRLAVLAGVTTISEPASTSLTSDPQKVPLEIPATGHETSGSS